MTVEIAHKQPFDVSVDTYWRELALNLHYQERLYCGALGCVGMDVVEHHGDPDTGIRRRLRFQKPIDAPAPIKKIFGSTVTIEEVGSFDPKTQTWSYRMVPAIMADRIDIRGEIRVVPRGSGIEQQSRNIVTCRIFGLGAVVEHFVAKSTREANADKAAFTRRYIAERDLAEAAQRDKLKLSMTSSEGRG